jgi:GT2 family glycosyltransferase
MKRTLASVTIAYNAAQSLPRQMDALLGQTHPLQEIVVVDNASTDGTRELLAEQYPQVTVLGMKENLGAAGAWAEGLSYAALERGYDWVWTFDQDSVPETNALGTLLAGLQESDGLAKEIGMVVPMAVHRDTATLYPPMLWRDGFVKLSAEQMRQPIWFADVAITSGSLVLREVVQEVGVPRADFFMDISDVEYCLRIRLRGYRIAVISGAVMSHEIGNTRKVNLLGYKRSWMNQPPFREYYISRNLAYLAWRLYPNLATKIFIARHLMMHLAGVLLFSSDGLACAIGMVQGFRDGLRGRLGIRVTPRSK